MNSNSTLNLDSPSNMSQNDAKRPKSGTFMWPEEAPTIPANMMPTGCRLTGQLWQELYSLLYEQRGNWMDVRSISVHYLMHYSRALSNETLKEETGFRSLKQLFTDIPYVEVKETQDGAVFVRLGDWSLKRKATAMNHITGPGSRNRPKSSLNGKATYDAWVEESWVWYPVPDQPEETLPSEDVRITNEFRRCIYELLMNYFPNGTDISTFVESYSRRYGFPLTPQTDCGMYLEEVLYFIADIVDTGKNGADGQLWLRPVPYEQVKQLLKRQKAEQAAIRQRNLEIQREEKPAENHIPDDDTDAINIRAEIAECLERFPTGISANTLAIFYGMIHPSRQINGDNVGVFVEWLKTMDDLVDVYQKKEDGKEVPYTKLRR